MPVVTRPDLVEQNDFLGGYAPDVQPSASEANELLDSLNLLPDLGDSKSLVTRKGFYRTRGALGATSAVHYIKHVFPFLADDVQYIICVLTDETANANNMQLFAVKVSDSTVARIDTAGRVWANSKKDHWGMNIQNIWYGGSPGNEVYSWNPTGSVWNAAANSNAAWDTVVDSISPGANEKARDFAYKGTEKVIYSGKVYTPAHGIRFKEWDNDQGYDRGERVSRKAAIGGFTYWRSYRCHKEHDSTTPGSAPGTGAETKKYWNKIRLPLPVNADNETSGKWYFVPTAPGTSVAEWHADRIWMRYDGEGDKSRVLYSAPMKLEKGVDIPDVIFKMTDFQPGNDLKGPGGGWIPFNDGRSGGVVEALYGYGQYLLVFKRQAVYALSGLSEDSFTNRRLARGIGAVGPGCVTELDGLVYFLGDDGLYLTDGTSWEPVKHLEKVQATITARIDAMAATGDNNNPQVWTWNHQIWIALPVRGASEPYLTLVYDPRYQSWWKTNLPVLAARHARADNKNILYFSAPGTYAAGTSDDLLYTYDHPSAADVDDTGANAYASAPITWFLRTSWWAFGLLREQRRIRRTWAVVKGALTYTFTRYRDWSDSDTSTVGTRVVAGSSPVHIEGSTFPDSHAVSFKLSGAAAPAAVMGIAVDTQPRRHRYHT